MKARMVALSEPLSEGFLLELHILTRSREVKGEVSLFLISHTVSTVAKLGDFFIHLVLHHIDYSVYLVIPEVRKLSFGWQIGERFNYDFRLSHQVHEFDVVIPVAFPRDISDDLIELCTPQV
jgi:hypothetical protein